MNYSAVLFDFDYTLADSSKGIVTCFQHVLHKQGFAQVSDEEIKRTIGKTLDESFSLLTGMTDPEEIERWKKQYTQEADQYMTANTFFFPDTLEVLRKLKQGDILVGIISTKYRFRILDFLESYLPENKIAWDVLIGGEDVTHHKPDPEGLNKAIRQLGLLPSQVLYVGDSTIDAETASHAGVDFVGVTTGMTTRSELENYPHLRVINDLSELYQAGILLEE